MTLRNRSILIAFVSAVLFSLLYFAGFFRFAEQRLYDLFLRFRPGRERIEQVVFLDVDDQAISHIGVFPWPRSVMGDGLLRLKEYGVTAAVFDIEYIDESPAGLDDVYLRQLLKKDFDQSFITIDSYVSELFTALRDSRLSLEDALDFSGELSGIISTQRDDLYTKTQGLARDNDEYLSQSSRLFGRTWGTLNLQALPLPEEQADRRIYAQEMFSYPIENDHDYPKSTLADVLPPIPQFMESLEGAGYTNVTIDDDGVRRRIYLAQRVDGYWYLQLAFAPLIHMMGNPDIAMEPGKMTIRGAQMPDGTVQDIFIPLDEKGAMLLDWPKTSYEDSYEHISFGHFSELEETENSLYSLFYNVSDLGYWSQLMDDDFFYYIYLLLQDITACRDGITEARRYAVEENSEEDFEEYLYLKQAYRDMVQEFIELEAMERLIQELELQFSAEAAAELAEETAYLRTLSDNIVSSYNEITTTHNWLMEMLPGKLCIIGRSDTGTTDIGVNPFYGHYVNVGTHAVVLDTILSQSFITPLSQWWSILITLVLVPLVIIAIGGFRPGMRSGLGFGTALLIFGFSLVLFIVKGIFLGPLGPTLAMVVAVVVREVVAFVSSEQEKSFIRKAFSTYLSGAVVEEILNDPSRLQLGGSKRYMSAIFTDVKGFSTISEKLDPEDLVRLLNQYLSAMSNVVLDERGTIDKYEGDAIIAFFGAPIDLPEHALKACRSAIIMKRVERELNTRFIADGLSPSPLLTRIGVNTGNMVVGNMGTEQKMDYTIMGNAVNLAARLEGVNKQYGTWILASDTTVQDAGPSILTRRLDRVRVVGIHEPVQLHEILELRDDAPDYLREKADLFHSGLDFFEAKDWSRAEAAFRKVLDHDPDDGPGGIYLNRCIKYQKTPPAKNWDGVFNLNQK
ncbi:CHASE2 domain-containing protein [Breznakiella homolactica]|uniref:Adenylate/guanylate cyclase domain-containing protein n=1 Tax=Breznakiella homolactica TaxID=2798577 RepID=A0A7T7XKC6_9SPIR|nr:CHASE2 domain-containing protein [Breznakiella homolactica]QQO07994.1 CHASE2 domain-containing protein [Breznakiella homolactica]